LFCPDTALRIPQNLVRHRLYFRAVAKELPHLASEHAILVLAALVKPIRCGAIARFNGFPPHTRLTNKRRLFRLAKRDQHRFSGLPHIRFGWLPGDSFANAIPELGERHAGARPSLPARIARRRFCLDTTAAQRLGEPLPKTK
jgi:hypothetical protein